MKICTSYFYKVRFFDRTMIPMSTAVWDPAWWHKNTKDYSYQFKDKNGVINGIRATPFVPGHDCDGKCRGQENCDTKNSHDCEFLKAYRAQLDALNFDEIMARFAALGKTYQERENISDEVTIVLLVYETPTNPCSERVVIQEWFAAHGLKVEEWQESKGSTKEEFFDF